MGATTIEFPPFELDLRAGQLRRDGTPIPLRPKTFAVLQHLAERPGQIGATKGLFLEGLLNTPHLGRSQSFRLLRHKSQASART